MSINCPNCREPNSTNVDYCHYCDAAISEYAQKRAKQRQCSNCRTMNSDSGDFCHRCGMTLTDYAKKLQRKNRSKRMQEFEERNDTLRREKSDIEEMNKKYKAELEETQKENTKLKKELNEELIKNGKNGTVIPNWTYYVFSVISILFLVLLIIFRNGQ